MGRGKGEWKVKKKRTEKVTNDKRGHRDGKKYRGKRKGR